MDIHAPIRNDLDLSLDFLSWWDYDRVETYCGWFAEQEIEGVSRLVDVGCGNGLITCFYATRFPDAEVIGLDTPQWAVNCAGRLAKRLELENVRFVRKDCRKFREVVGDEPVDLVTSNLLLHEVHPPGEYLTAVHDALLPADGFGLFLERPPDQHHLARLVQHIEAAGLTVADQGFTLRCKSLGYGGEEMYTLIPCQPSM